MTTAVWGTGFYHPEQLSIEAAGQPAIFDQEEIQKLELARQLRPDNNQRKQLHVETAARETGGQLEQKKRAINGKETSSRQLGQPEREATGHETGFMKLEQHHLATTGHRTGFHQLEQQHLLAAGEATTGFLPFEHWPALTARLMSLPSGQLSKSGVSR
jgi:hypothetical protein